MMFEKRVRYDMAYIVMVAGVLVIAIIETVGDKIGLGGMAASIQNLPLGQFGFTWFVPSLVCFAIGYVIGKMGVGKTIDDHPDTGGF